MGVCFWGSFQEFGLQGVRVSEGRVCLGPAMFLPRLGGWITFP